MKKKRQTINSFGKAKVNLPEIESGILTSFKAYFNSALSIGVCLKNIEVTDIGI